MNKIIRKNKRTKCKDSKYFLIANRKNPLINDDIIDLLFDGTNAVKKESSGMIEAINSGAKCWVFDRNSC